MDSVFQKESFSGRNLSHNGLRGINRVGFVIIILICIIIIVIGL